jgi:hypothetical protein
VLYHRGPQMYFEVQVREIQTRRDNSQLGIAHNYSKYKIYPNRVVIVPLGQSENILRSFGYLTLSTLPCRLRKHIYSV